MPNEEITYRINNKDFKFIKPNMKFRIWGNYIIGKYRDFTSSLCPLQKKRTELALAMPEIKNVVANLVNQNITSDTEKNPAAILQKENINNLASSLSGEFMNIAEELEEKEKIYRDNFLFGRIEETGEERKTIPGYYKEILSNCLDGFKDSDIQDEANITEETMGVIYKVFDDFFLTTGKRPK